MVDNNSQALAAVRRSARAAEKRLNATEAEMRFASDIAAGIYTADMIPPVMDAGKIMELADCYIAERAFEVNDIHPEINSIPEQEDTPSVPPDVSISVPNTSEDDLLDMVNGMRTSAMYVSDARTAANSGSSSSIPKKSTSISLYLFLCKLRPWAPAIGILFLFIVLCVCSYLGPLIRSLQTDADPPSRSVDYKTRYVGSVNSSFIHLDTCRHADNIQDGNRVYYESLADALADGRSKCSTCLSGTSSTSSGAGITPVPVTPPENGEVVKDTKEEKLAPLTIKTSGTSDYYIALKCIDVPNAQFSSAFVREYDTLRHDMSFYIKGGKTAEILVPLAEYEIYYAVGDTWYGASEKFGEDTQYYKCEDTFLFEEQWDDEGMYYSGWTITLYAVPGGNMASDEIPASEFPL